MFTECQIDILEFKRDVFNHEWLMMARSGGIIRAGKFNHPMNSQIDSHIDLNSKKSTSRHDPGPRQSRLDKIRGGSFQIEQYTNLCFRIRGAIDWTAPSPWRSTV